MPDGTERVLFDPMLIDPSGTTTVSSAQPSPDGSRVAYLIEAGGREEAELRIVDIETLDLVEAPRVLGRGAAMTWRAGTDDIYVVHRLPELPEDEQQFHRRVYRHRIGDTWSDEEMVFGEGRDRRTYFGIGCSVDGRWLIVTGHVGTEPRNDFYLFDLQGGGGPATVMEGEDAQLQGSVLADGQLWLWTTLDAPNARVVVADTGKPTPDHWVDRLEETEFPLADWSVTDDAVIAIRTRDAVSEITVHDRETGSVRHVVELPGLGSAMTVGRPGGVGNDVWVAYTDHVSPTVILRHEVSTSTTTEWARAPGAPESGSIRVEQVKVTSEDGTQVPLFVLRPDDGGDSRPRPTVLNGYGGFNIAMTPAYSTMARAWVDQGGVWAIACLRGGGEYGEEWHRDGMRANKQHVYEDLEACADWLVDAGTTTSDQLALFGGSNGGLLVGAALTRRPDAYRAVVCSAPLLDMVRYELFGLGETWNDEYGSAAIEEEFGWLISYSPYHNVREGAPYPAVLFTVFEGDTRVDPLHARKLCAALQHATSADPRERPILIRRETNVGHAARSVSRFVDLWVDELSFLTAQLR
jgi:prolyl oligopeptidase